MKRNRWLWDPVKTYELEATWTDKNGCPHRLKMCTEATSESMAQAKFTKLLKEVFRFEIAVKEKSRCANID